MDIRDAIDRAYTWSYATGTASSSTGTPVRIKNNGKFEIYGHEFKISGGDLDSIEVNSDDITTINVSPHKPIGMTGCSGDFYYYNPMTLPSYKKRKKNNYEIKKIQLNPKKNATTVLWEDGTYTVVKKSPGDDPADIWSVVSYALAEKVYGSNSAFKREIKGKVQNLNER